MVQLPTSDRAVNFGLSLSANPIRHHRMHCACSSAFLRYPAVSIVLLAACGACKSDSPVTPPPVQPPVTRATLRASVRLDQPSAGTRLDVRAWYRQAGGTRVDLATASLNPVGPAVLTIPLAFDVKECSVDPLRDPAGGACPVRVDALLFGVSGPIADSVTLEPILLQAAADSTVPPNLPLTLTLVDSVAIFDAPPILSSGATAQARAVLSGANRLLPARRVVWRSSNDSVFTVSATGNIAALRAGTANVIAFAAEDTTRRSSRSITIPAPPSFAYIAAGGMVSCALKADGAAFCWGSNFRGAVGNGSTLNQNAPTAVSGGYRFRSISVGEQHACGMTLNGEALCWGDNLTGMLGTGGASLSPVPVSPAGGLAFSQVNANGRFTCGLTTAKEAYCWGFNLVGQLGDGTTTDRSVPTRVLGDIRFDLLVVGQNHVCGRDASRTAYCWGSNSRGALGTAPSTPTTAPSPVVGLSGVEQLALNGSSTCAVTTNSALYCWGNNTVGQLGDGTRTDHSTATLIQQPFQIAQISVGGEHSCAVTANGGIQCWGGNASGELGVGTTTPSLTPAPINASATFQRMSSSYERSCALSVTGTYYCWGRNGGSLGDGTGTNRASPVALVLPP